MACACGLKCSWYKRHACNAIALSEAGRCRIYCKLTKAANVQSLLSAHLADFQRPEIDADAVRTVEKVGLSRT